MLMRSFVGTDFNYVRTQVARHCVRSVCASSRSCISKDIVAALHDARGSLTACIYRRLYLARLLLRRA